jgi:carbon storage regulator
MLVLTRKCEESIVLAGNVEIKILNIRGDQVSLGFEAPNEVSIYRKEVYDAIERENREAALRDGKTWESVQTGVRAGVPSDQDAPRREGTADS